MQTRRKTRLGIVLAVLVGLGLTIGLTLYALSANIDLFYTPGEILYGKTETHQRPHHGQRLRIGGYVQPGSVKRDPQTLDVSFRLYDARGVVEVSYRGILPDLFREGQGVVAQAEPSTIPRVRNTHAAWVHGRDQRAQAVSSRPASSDAIAKANATEKPT